MKVAFSDKSGISMAIVTRSDNYWELFWSTLVSAVVESEAPDEVVLTFGLANNSLTKDDFSIEGFTISSLGRDATNKILILTLTEEFELDTEAEVTFDKTGESYSITNNVAFDWDAYWATRTPSNIVLTPVSDTSIQVDWTDGVETADGIRIYVDGIPDGTANFGDETYTITGLIEGTEYTITVVAYSGTYESPEISDSEYTFVLKKAGLIARYAADEELAALMDSYAEKISFCDTSIITKQASLIAHNNYHQDVGIGANVAGTQSVFVVNSITPNNQQYYQDQDDLEDEADKGILAFFVNGGYNYCLQRVIYPDDPLLLIEGTEYQLRNFSTISGGSDITITPTIVAEQAVYLDSTKAYAADFPASALDKWWTMTTNGDGTYKLKMNAKFTLEEYCGSAISASHDYTAPNQLVIIAKETYYPHLTGLKYQYQENIRTFAAFGLPAPKSMSETESGGYMTWTLGGDGWYDILHNLDYLGTTKNPAGKLWINIKAENINYRYRIPATTPLKTLGVLQDMKEFIAYEIAKNNFISERDVAVGDPLNLAIWESLIIWCQANEIPILSYADYGEKHFDREYVPLQNIFPRLNKDLAERADGTPDGFEALHADISLEAAGGIELDGGYYLEFTNATAQSADIDGLAGFELGDGEVSLWAKNDGTQYDTICVKIGSGNWIRNIYFHVNNIEWTKFTAYFLNYNVTNDVKISISTWASAGTVDISGIEIKDRVVELSDGLEEETQALITRMTAAGSTPDAARQTLIDNTIKGLKKAEVVEGFYVNLWDKVIAMHTHAAHSEAAAKLNWHRDAYNITTYNAPTYITDRGWNQNGTNQYTGTGFNPYSIADELKEWLLNDATLMVYINVNDLTYEYAPDIGARPGTNGRSLIAVNYAEANGSWGINSSAVSIPSLPGNRMGMFGISVLNENIDYAIVGTSSVANNSVRGTITNAELLYNRYGTSYGSNRNAFGLIAKGMTANEMLKFASIVITEYLTPIGATI